METKNVPKGKSLPTEKIVGPPEVRRESLCALLFSLRLITNSPWPKALYWVISITGIPLMFGFFKF